MDKIWVLSLLRILAFVSPVAASNDHKTPVDLRLFNNFACSQSSISNFEVASQLTVFENVPTRHCEWMEGLDFISQIDNIFENHKSQHSSGYSQELRTAARRSPGVDFCSSVSATFYHIASCNF